MNNKLKNRRKISILDSVSKKESFVLERIKSDNRTAHKLVVDAMQDLEEIDNEISKTQQIIRHNLSNGASMDIDMHSKYRDYLSSQITVKSVKNEKKEKLENAWLEINDRLLSQKQKVNSLDNICEREKKQFKAELEKHQQKELDDIWLHKKWRKS